MHNIRIERLWCDVTRGFGRKWYNFFFELEFACGLEPDLDAHIWLLHHLFLPAINQDAQDWARTWNEHKIRFNDERTRSPRDMFFFGMVQNGPRGILAFMDDEDDGPVLDDEDEDIEDLTMYGVDWDDINDDAIIAHHNEFNETEDPEEGEDEVFFNHGPRELSHVEIEEPLCPFTEEEVAYIDEQLTQYPASQSRSMTSRRTVWIYALGISREIQ